jgi:hypothetical protein
VREEGGEVERREEGGGEIAFLMCFISYFQVLASYLAISFSTGRYFFVAVVIITVIS